MKITYDKEGEIIPGRIDTVARNQIKNAALKSATPKPVQAKKAVKVYKTKARSRGRK